MRKPLSRGYVGVLDVGDLAELSTWSRQWVLRDLKRGALAQIAVPCVCQLTRGKHHRVFDTPEVREFCEMVREAPIDSRGQRRFDRLAEIDTKRRRESLGSSERVCLAIERRPARRTPTRRRTE